MKRLIQGEKRALRRTLSDRWRIPEPIYWMGCDVNESPDRDFFSIYVDPDDSNSENVPFRSTPTDRRFESFQNRRFCSNQVPFVFDDSPQLNELSTTQVVWRRLSDKRNLAFLFSLFVHIALALILLSLALSVRVGTVGAFVDGGFLDDDELDFVDESGISSEDDVPFEVVSESVVAETASQLLINELANVSDTDQLDETSGSKTPNEVVPLEDAVVDTTGGGTPFFQSVGDAIERAARKRGSQGLKGDVTRESEDAVERGLDWLARHQLPDGGWSFDLTVEDDHGRSSSCHCSNSTATSGGSAYLQRLHPSRTAATAIALLPFLGSGYTHVESSPYQKTVASGLRYLEYHATVKEDGVDFRDGFIDDGASYVQALVVLTCCEAYEMTKDSNLKSLAEGGVRFIERSQLRDGGWRYSSIGDSNFHDTVSGDLSVLGWQMLALHSGVSAGFSLSPSVAYRASSFLDLVMDDNGRSYRYRPETKEDVSKRWGTTAVGVLMREYLGWTPSSDPDVKNELDRGAEQLAQWIDLADNHWQNARKSVQGERNNRRKIIYVRDGRVIYNLYFAYYAALALRSYGGRYWEEGYPKLRELLIATQTSSSVLSLNHCEDGSWLFYDQYMNDGGRLLNTALAVLILETPYRYLPMYR